LVTVLCFSCSLYFVCGQPSGAPVPNYFLNDGNRLDAWVWLTVSYAALQAGKTYTIGANLTGLGASGYSGQAEVNITFTVNAGCNTSYCSSCVSTYGAPSNNQGWRYAITHAAISSDLSATPSPGVQVWTGPTEFGGSRLPKISFYFDHIDVCNCIFVNYISFTTTDLNTTGTHHPYYWDSVSYEKKRGPEKRCRKREEGSLVKRGGPVPASCSWLSYWGTACEIAFAWAVGDPPVPCCFLCPTLLAQGSNLAPIWARYFDGNWPLAKRTNPPTTLVNYYVYWINVNQSACKGIGTYEDGQSGSLGSYGNGPSGSVNASASLGVTYI